MANSLFQGMIHQMKDVMDLTVGVVDDKCVVNACSDLSKIAEKCDWITSSDFYANDVFTKNGYIYKVFGSAQNGLYLAFVHGSGKHSIQHCKMLAIYLSNIKVFHDEKYDKCSFVKNIVLDNILPGDIYIKARELHLNADITRVVLLVRTNHKGENSAFEGIKSVFPDRHKDFVFTINETDTVVVKEIREDTEGKDIEKLASSLVETLRTEYLIQTSIGIGNSVVGIKNIGKSFKEAQISLEVGKVFDTEKSVLKYDNLGVGRLIYQLPTTLCDVFLREVFIKGSINTLDNETLFTIQRFFENNLNVSETSRCLFVHRNTLVYRLEKIKKLTGLDLREFDHAIVFKIALMVKKYLDSNPTKF